MYFNERTLKSLRYSLIISHESVKSKYFEEMFPPFLNDYYVLDADLGVDIALVNADKANVHVH